jgi:hypothetical protein
MSIILSIIAKQPDNVLCEYTDYSGNFQQVSRLVLQKVNQNTKCSINHDK